MSYMKRYNITLDLFGRVFFSSLTLISCLTFLKRMRLFFLFIKYIVNIDIEITYRLLL
jgi:hypothetical protein